MVYYGGSIAGVESGDDGNCNDSSITIQ